MAYSHPLCQPLNRTGPQRCNECAIFKGCTLKTYIIGKMQPASLVFEGKGLMAFEIRPTIDMAISELQGMVNNEGLFEVDSMLRFF